ncbi:potassium channel [Aureococcus anophagefferens]|nr:potassium channel [Aureococcus anophagefferens]
MSSLDDASKPRRVAGLLILAYFLIGTIYYHFFALPEHFAFVDAVYFCVTTITTVGYGDTNTRYNEDHSEEDMLFTSFFVLSGVGIVAAPASSWLTPWTRRTRPRALAKGDDDADARKPRRFVLGRKLSEAESKYGERLDPGEFREILQSFRGTGLDGGGFDACSRTEFVMCMLVKLERVDRSDIRRCVEVFGTPTRTERHADAKDLEGAGAYEPPAPAPLT